MDLFSKNPRRITHSTHLLKHCRKVIAREKRPRLVDEQVRVAENSNSENHSLAFATEAKKVVAKERHTNFSVHTERHSGTLSLLCLMMMTMMMDRA